MITVEIDGIFSPMLERGLDRQRFSALIPDLIAAQRELNARRSRDIGFYDAPLRRDLVQGVLEEVRRLRAIADDLLVLGIGGSSLGGQALCAALGHTSEREVRVHFLDNIDPDSVVMMLESLEPERTAAAVITKSGDTVETLAQLLVVRRWFRASLGQGEARSRMTYVTDPNKGTLRDLARSEGIRAFDIPPEVGGRYSVLTPVGLLPAAFLGIDIIEVLAGAADMAERVGSINVEENPACLFAAGAMLAQKELGRNSLVMMPYADSLRVATAWFVQLWAESLGKRFDRYGKEVHSGQTPIPALGAIDQHAQLQLFIEGPTDKAICMVAVEKFRHELVIPDELAERDELNYLCGRDLGELFSAERRGTRAALLDAGVPVLDISIPMVDEQSFGGFLLLLEAASACAGLLIGVNPFDQPGVEAGKRMTMGLIGRAGYSEDIASVIARESLADRLT
ncbi:MAG: glucose-6-phosphate isomerase [Deltaproteobacteria bacterium]|nr:glucose-6-phosphate isomerase [Deltaproteobacteria bacterium]